MRTLLALLTLATSCCGSEPPHPSEPAAQRAQPSASAEASEPPSIAAATDETAPEAAPPEAEAQPTEPDFAAPIPNEPCPETRVRLAHRSADALPPVLTHAAALRSDDGKHLRIVLADHPLERDARGRFQPVRGGRARFEFDAVRTRRRPLEPGRLRAPGDRRGGLTHVRIVSEGADLPFGHRDIGRVELTEISPERICGRIDLDDGFGRVRGAFTATAPTRLGD